MSYLKQSWQRARKRKIINLVEREVELCHIETAALNRMLKSRSNNTVRIEINKDRSHQRAPTITLLTVVFQVQHQYQKCKLFNRSMAQESQYR